MDKVVSNATVFKFVMFYDTECRPEDRQERYVVAMSEDEAIQKFYKYLDQLVEQGLMRPVCFTHNPQVEIDYCIL